MRRILPDPSNANLMSCSRCGLQNDLGSTHCAACGNDLTNPQTAISPQPPAPVGSPLHPTPVTGPSLSSPAPVVTTGSPAQKRPWREYFGWRSIDGTVIHVGPSQLIKAPRHWWKLIVKLVVAVIAVATFGALALIVIVSLFAFSLLLSWLFPRYERGRGGFLQSIASQFVSFFLTSRLLGQKPTVPSCDYRLRDSSGNQHLVRVEGYVHAGGMTVGDDVIAEGYDRQGTLVMKQGWNKRLGTLIKVKDR